MTQIFIGVGFILLIVSICLPVVNSKNKPNQKDQLSHDKFDAFMMSQEFVKNHLKSPAAAEFPKYNESFVFKYISPDYPCYIIEAYVDARNSFGAKIRNKYTCELRAIDGKNWSLEHISIK